MTSQWSVNDNSLNRDFKFRSFAQAMSFMLEVALYCEKADYHPDWRNVYNRLHVRLTTHDAGGVTDKDHALAAHMDAVFARHTA